MVQRLVYLAVANQWVVVLCAMYLDRAVPVFAHSRRFSGT
jgi:hypothetical protein